MKHVILSKAAHLKPPSYPRHKAEETLRPLQAHADGGTPNSNHRKLARTDTPRHDVQQRNVRLEEKLAASRGPKWLSSGLGGLEMPGPQPQNVLFFDPGFKGFKGKHQAFDAPRLVFGKEITTRLPRKDRAMYPLTCYHLGSQLRKLSLAHRTCLSCLSFP